MEGEAESTEVVDQQGGEEYQHDRHENPKQRPQEARHTAANAHGGQLPANSQSMQGTRARFNPPFDDHSGQVWAGLASFAPGFGHGEISPACHELMRGEVRNWTSLGRGREGSRPEADQS